MSKRDQFKNVQFALGVQPATGIPNDATKHAWTALWDAALAEYRDSQGPAEPPASAVFAVGADHWLTGIRRDALPGGYVLVPRALVIHFTAGATGASSIQYWRDLGTGVCAHLVIERDGTVIQCRPFDRTCGHAGVSRWRDPATQALLSGMNGHSIGIELANAGDDAGALSWARKQPGFASVRARHRNGGPEKEWEGFPAAQLAACTEVAKALTGRYRLTDVTGHDCIAPERKNDPGPAFPMEALRSACGFTGLPAVLRP